MKTMYKDGKTEIYIGNNIVGYVETGMLYGIDRKGYAIEITMVSSNADATKELEKWRNSSGG